MQGVFLDFDSMGDGGLDASVLEAALPQWRYHGNTTREQVAARISDAAVAITNKVYVDEQAMAQAEQLKLVCVSATGTNNVDLEAAQRLGIAVCNVRGYATPSVAQHVFAMMLNLFTRMPLYDQAVREGRWQHSEHFCFIDYPITELAGKVLGVVGYGELGQTVARLAEAFDMQVLVAQRPGSVPRRDRVPLKVLLPQVDVLSLHCPLTPETEGLIGAAELQLMRPAAVVINTARGGIVDEAALAEALRRGRLAGAGVDVLSEEPPRQGNPLLADDIPNLIITPHVAWASVEARQRLLAEVAQNIHAFFNGRRRNRVV